MHDGFPPLGANFSAVAPLQPDNFIRDLEIAVHTCLRTPYEGSLALPYKDPVRIGPDTPLPRTRRSAVVLFVCPQLDRFASVHSYTKFSRSKFRSKFTRVDLLSKVLNLEP